MAIRGKVEMVQTWRESYGQIIQSSDLMATDTHDNPWPDWENIPSPQPLQQQRQKSPTGTIGSTNPWASRPATIANLSDAEDEDEIRESAELTGADIWRNEFLARAQTYPEGGSIGGSSHVEEIFCKLIRNKYRLAV
jgi:hypothetical protein